MVYYKNDELYHYGILGQKWGVRRYQNKDGSLTSEGRNRYYSKADQYNKEHPERSKTQNDDISYQRFKRELERKTGLKAVGSLATSIGGNALIGSLVAAGVLSSSVLFSPVPAILTVAPMGATIVSTLIENDKIGEFKEERVIKDYEKRYSV